MWDWIKSLFATVGLPRPMVAVTQDDIDDGVAESPTDCAIALAVKRIMAGIMKDVRHVDVSIGGIRARDRSGTIRWEMKATPQIDAFVRLFDQGLTVKPFTFKLKPKVPKVLVRA